MLKALGSGMLLLLLSLFVGGCAALAPKVKGFNAKGDGLDCRTDFRGRIVNGRTVQIEEAISKEAVLLITQRNGASSSCTGVPVAPRLILTAAHCVKGANPTSVTAVFHTDMKCATGYTREKTISSVTYSIHQDYDGTPQGKADLALVKLSAPIPANYPVATVYDGKTKLSSDEVLMLGYGITDETLRDSLILRTTTKSFHKDAYVKDQLLLFKQDNKTGGFCRGDSGAPIYVTCGGVKKIVGINSFNIGKSKDKECHTASAAMYMPYFNQWIQNQILQL